MQFVHPEFLWGLLTLIIPILIHLFNFRRYKKVMFSNVAMLRKIETQSKRSRQLKRWLVLLSRLLALAALVFAFAQPYIPKKSEVKGSTAQVIYIDNSFSMYARGEGGQLFEEAKNAARTLIGGLDVQTDILLFSNTGRAKWLKKGRALDWVDELEISSEVNSLSNLSAGIKEKIAAEGYDHAAVFMLSDLQETEALPTTTDSSLHFYALGLKPQGAQNLSIDSVWLASPVNRINDPIQLNVKLSNHGSEKIQNANVVLNINGVQQGSESFSIDEHSGITLAVSFKSSEKGWLKCELVLADPVVIFDNQYYFSLELKEKFSVMVLSSKPSAFAKVFKNDTQFELVETNPLQLDYSTLFAYDMVVLDGEKEVSMALANQLGRFVEEGGILFFSPSKDGVEVPPSLGITQYGQLLQPELSIRQTDLEHPFFKGVYERLPQNSLMPKITRCYLMNSGKATEELLKLKDGTKILLRSSKGKGYIYQWAVPTDRSWSVLPEHELFVITGLQAAFSKRSFGEIAYPVDYSGAVSVNASNTDRALVLSKDGIETIVESSAVLGKFRFWLNSEIQDAGIYNLHFQDRQNTLAEVALNYNRKESAQKYYSKEALSEVFGDRISYFDDSAETLQTLASETISSRAVWKLFVIFCLIFLLLEILLLRFLKS